MRYKSVYVSRASCFGLVLAHAAAMAWSFGYPPSKLPLSTQTDPPACPDQILSRGKYRNDYYKFSLRIPDGYEGLWNSVRCSGPGPDCTCMSDHGRIIPLTKEPYAPQRHIEIFAGYPAEAEDATVTQQVEEHLSWIRERSADNTMTILHHSRMKLAGVPAERVVVRYYDQSLQRWWREDRVESLRNGVAYMLYLRTSEETYPQDRSVFQAVLTSFAFLK